MLSNTTTLISSRCAKMLTVSCTLSLVLTAVLLSWTARADYAGSPLWVACVDGDLTTTMGSIGTFGSPTACAVGGFNVSSSKAQTALMLGPQNQCFSDNYNYIWSYYSEMSGACSCGSESFGKGAVGTASDGVGTCSQTQTAVGV